MYTVPLEALLRMTCVRPHQELLEEGVLVRYSKGMGKAVFVSHQWLSESHPDPECRQLKVLQAALQNLLLGVCKVSSHPTVEVYYGDQKAYTSADLKVSPVFVWYDYFACPQLYPHDCRGDGLTRLRSRSLSENPFEELKNAIATQMNTSRNKSLSVFVLDLKGVQTLVQTVSLPRTPKGQLNLEFHKTSTVFSVFMFMRIAGLLLSAMRSPYGGWFSSK